MDSKRYEIYVELERYLKEHPEELNNKDEYGQTALMICCVRENNKAVKLLIDAGCDLGARNCYSFPALIVGVRYGNSEAVKLLIDAGCDINIRDDYKQTALLWACRYGNIEAARLLVAAGCDLNMPNHYEQSPLIAACRNSTALSNCKKNNLEIARLLIDSGCDLYKKCNNGWTALKWACKASCSYEIVKLLVDSYYDQYVCSLDRVPMSKSEYMFKIVVECGYILCDGKGIVEIRKAMKVFVNEEVALND